MLIIGLTGGIGSGKSTVEALFKQLGVPVIDADDVGKSLVTPGSPTLNDIANQFGSSVLNPNGSLNRGALREIIFTDPKAKKQLEAILHPAILDEMLKQAQHINASYCILSIPLLFESGQNCHVTRTLVVDCPVELQKERAAKRDGLSLAQIDAIITSQASRETRLAQADDVIDNSRSLDELNEQITALHNKFLTIAHQQHN